MPDDARPPEAPPGAPLDDLVRQLQRLPPDAFTAERDALAKRLRAAGRRDDATIVTARRRPTVVAWAADQLALRTPDDLEGLFRATDELAAAQEALLGGGGRDALRAAAGARRAIVERLARTAGAWLVGEGVADAPHLDELMATLEAAAADAEVGEELRGGLLVRERAAPSGFGLDGMALSVAPAPAARRRAATGDGVRTAVSGREVAGREVAGRTAAEDGGAGATGGGDEAADAAAAEAARVAAERAAALAATAGAASSAAIAAEAADAAAAAAEAARDDAAAELEAAEDRLAAARSALEAAAAELDRRRAAADDAREAADAAEDQLRAARAAAR